VQQRDDHRDLLRDPPLRAEDPVQRLLEGRGALTAGDAVAGERAVEVREEVSRQALPTRVDRAHVGVQVLLGAAGEQRVLAVLARLPVATEQRPQVRERAEHGQLVLEQLVGLALGLLEVARLLARDPPDPGRVEVEAEHEPAQLVEVPPSALDHRGVGGRACP
jgi:hypothetical protein